MTLHVSSSDTPPLSRFPRLTREQEGNLLARARAGGDPQVQQEIVLSLQPRLYTLARRYARTSSFLDSDDLVSCANIAILEKFQHALLKNNPYAYLYRVAQKTMLASISGRYDFVKRHSEQERIPITSLDIPLEDDGTTLADVLPQASESRSDASRQEQLERISMALYRAIEALPEKQKFVIQRSFGLGGHAPERINDISRQLQLRGTSSHPSNAHYHSKHALRTLHHVLSPLFPQYTTAPSQKGVTAQTGE